MGVALKRGRQVVVSRTVGAGDQHFVGVTGTFLGLDGMHGYAKVRPDWAFEQMAVLRNDKGERIILVHPESLEAKP